MSLLQKFLDQFSAGGGAEYQDWYGSLVKPFFAPPDWLFGVAWGLIYPLIIIALIWALIRFRRSQLSKLFLTIFVINLIFNLLFTPISLVLRNNLLGSLDILLVVGTLIYLEVCAWRHHRGIFWLLLPYLLWGTFATVLQISITLLH